MIKALLLQNSDLIAQVILALVTLYIVKPLMSRFHIENNAKRGAVIENAVLKGLNAAIQSVTTGKSVATTLTSIIKDNSLRETAVGAATEYVKMNLPGTLKKLGLDDAQLAALVNSRVETALEQLADQYLTINKAVVQSTGTHDAA